MTFEQYEELKYGILAELHDVVFQHKANTGIYVSKGNKDKVLPLIKEVIELMMVYSDACEDQGKLDEAKHTRSALQYLKSENIEWTVGRFIELGKIIANLPFIRLKRGLLPLSNYKPPLWLDTLTTPSKSLDGI